MTEPIRLLSTIFITRMILVSSYLIARECILLHKQVKLCCPFPLDPDSPSFPVVQELDRAL